MIAMTPFLFIAVLAAAPPASVVAKSAPVAAPPAAVTSAAAPAGSGPGAPGSAAAPGRETIRALRATEPVTVDGVLSESVWQNAEPFTTLIQRDPVEGRPVSQRTEVRVAYDDDALYIGARLYDSAPESVMVRLARRDASIASDRFGVYLDPFRDKRSGYYFMVNAAGTLYDGTLANDVEEDKSWDAVWEARARPDRQGWTAEFRIPYSQLRFPSLDHRVWGINFVREIPRRREKAYAAYRPRKASGFVSRFPALVGIDDIRPAPSLELLPYATTQSEHLKHKPGDPFNDGSQIQLAAGGDLRSRIGGLTLNGTANPDFGQVEIDPATVNLTDYESFFEEKRPFFVEGASTFSFGRQGAGDYWDYDWDDPLFFYSRRIGRAPQGKVPSAAYKDVPTATRILGAAKLIGRLSPSWTLGTLSAVTDREEAALSSLSGQQTNAEIEPLTYYGVTRAQRTSAGRRTGLGILGTAAVRSFDDPTLRDQLNRASWLGGLDGWWFLDSKQTWVLSGWTGATRVEGTEKRMIALQRSSTHYFQRPDADHVEVDSSATSMSGWASRYWLNKQKGALQFNTGFGIMSPGFEANDLGFQKRSDLVNGHVGSGYKWTKPSRFWNYQSVKGAVFATYDRGGNLIGKGIAASAYTEFKGGQTFGPYATYNARTLDNRRTRGGPLTVDPPAWDFGADYLGDSQRSLYTYASAGGRYSTSGAWYAFAYPGVEWKPSAAFSVKVTPGYERVYEDAQFVTSVSAPGSPTYGRRYVFATLDQRTASASLRVNWTFTPRLSLQTYVQPFVSTAAYMDFKYLAAPESYEFVPTTYTGSPLNFTSRSLKGNAVLRWEYRPGSSFYLVWTQKRSEFEETASLLQFERAPDAVPENVFLVKMTYYFTR
jgi:hypothetical protein